MLMNITDRNLSCEGKTVEFDGYGVVDTKEARMNQSLRGKRGP